MKATDLITLCRSCAAEIYGTRKPTPDYGEAVARLLMGTAAQESRLVYRRQIGYDIDHDGGAWGLWQTEIAAVSDSLRVLRERPDIRERSAAWLLGYGRHDMPGILAMGGHGVMRLIHDLDPFACLMARLHYMRFQQAVPRDLRGQALYWKKYYNTSLGKGQPEQYITNFRSLVLPHLQGE